MQLRQEPAPRWRRQMLQAIPNRIPSAAALIFHWGFDELQKLCILGHNVGRSFRLVCISPGEADRSSQDNRQTAPYQREQMRLPSRQMRAPRNHRQMPEQNRRRRTLGPSKSHRMPGPSRSRRTLSCRHR